MPIEGFDVASYTNKMVDMFTSESSKEVTLLCENELMRVIIDHYGEDAAVDRYDDTHFTAKIEVNPSGTFYGWIFKFKGKIKNSLSQRVHYGNAANRSGIYIAQKRCY